MTAERWDRVKALFHAALERPSGERTAFLQDACGDDATLRSDVESLLAANADATHYMEHLAADAAASLLGGRRDLYESELIGPYRVVRRLAYGGMGAVYLAVRADETYQKRVAIKLVRRGMGTEDIIRRFHHERQTLAGLDHPNIARLLDGGSTADGVPYFVMEYVEGIRIDEYCDTHRLTLEERLSLFRTVCSAVHYAHQRLVVHRDLKPDNILVTPEGVPKLVDFGIAKVLASEAPQTDVTQMFGRLMTLRYASPEQVRGAPVTTASDVYSLGVLLYELLTGHRPYGEKGEDRLELERMVCEVEPVRPSLSLARVERWTMTDGSERLVDATTVAQHRGSSPAALARKLAGDLDTIVLMAMRKEPQRRYASVQQLSEDIGRWFAGLPVIAQRDTVAYRSRKFVARHKAGVAAAALLGVSLLAGIAGTSWQAQVAARQRDIARTEAAKAEQINLFVQNMLGSADPLGTGGRELTVSDALERAAERVETELADQPEVAAAVRATIGRSYLGLGLYDAAEPHLRAALDASRRLLAPGDPALADSLNGMAALDIARGEYEAAEPLLLEALAIYGDSDRDVELAMADTLNNLGSALMFLGRYEEAEARHRAAIEILRRRRGDASPRLAEVLNDLGVVFGQRGDFAGAEPFHRESLEILRRAYGEHPNVAAAYATLAYVLENQDQFDEAEAAYQESLRIRRRTLGAEHPDVAWTLYNYASMQQVRGRYEEAQAIAREVLELRGRTLADTHPVVAASLQVLGLSLSDAGDPRAAEPVLRESLELRRASLPEGHWLVASSQSVLGDCLTALGRFREAERLLLSGYQGLEKTVGRPHPRTREALERVISLYDAWDRPEEAAAYRERLDTTALAAAVQ